MTASNEHGDGTSIGEDDQLRDQEMIHEKLARDGLQGGYGAEPTETPEEQREHAVKRQTGTSGDKGDGATDYKPGQTDQPDRDESQGLTGTGPGQP